MTEKLKKHGSKILIVLAFLSGNGTRQIVDPLIDLSDELQEWTTSKKVERYSANQDGSTRLEEFQRYEDRDFQFDTTKAKGVK